MPIDLAPLPTRVRVVALDGTAAAVDAALGSITLDDVELERVEAPQPWTPSASSSLVDGAADVFLLVTASGVGALAAFLRVALERLRGDLTLGAVGPPLPGAREGRVLAPAGGLLLARCAAVRGAGGLGAEPFGPPPLELGARLWLAGFRVEAAGPEAAGADHPSEDEVRRGLAVSLEDDDLEAPPWQGPAPVRAREESAARWADLRATRRRGVVELVRLWRDWADEAERAGAPGDLITLVRQLAAPARAGPRHRVLVITMDVLAPAMAGPAIRALALATALAREHDVRLVTTARCQLSGYEFPVAHADDPELERLVGWADVIVLQGWVMVGRPWIAASDRVVIADVYDPMHLEQLEQARERDAEGRVAAVRQATATLNQQLRRADLVLCASPKQRDLWMGALAALGRVNPISYEEDPSLAELVAVVPFGTPDEPFPEVSGALKGVVPGIGPSDRVLLWGGGVYNWFDPLTLVRAVDRLRERVPDVRLYFMGIVHPNPGVPSMRMAADLRSLSDELGLTDRHVFFNDGWVPFEARAGYLRDADVAVSTHLDHVETAYSFRTRILDYLWAGLPVVATSGDGFAELVAARGAGRTVAPGDVEGLTDALADLLLDDGAAARAREASKALGAELSWARNVQPLLDACRRPRRAPDIACPALDLEEVGELEVGWRRDLVAAWTYLRRGGPRLLSERVRGRVRRGRASGTAG